ncbi:MAG: GNAT family N-acetyltransferase [Armatimonadetes bacterium]|nr:GNAT family N-acetyltransferase [Anaerolineae bacterium]
MIATRLATLDDTASLAFLRQERAALLRQIDARLLPAPFSLNPDNAHETVWVALNTERVVGYIVGCVQTSPHGTLPAGYGVITDLALDVHYYYGGLGRALVMAMRTWFTTQAVTHAFVLAPRYYAGEQAFWRALGATEAHTSPLPTSAAMIWMALP